MSEKPLNVAVIVGSVREGRIAPVIANWVVRQAEQREDVAIDLIDLVEARLPGELKGHFGGDKPAEVTALRPRLAAADAFVVVVPEYNRAYPGALKTMIDTYHAEWQAKPVGFVCYGGMSSGLRAVEQLRLVFAELAAVTIRDSVAFQRPWTMFDADGSWPADSSGCDAAAKTMLDQLVWYARALRDAKTVRPYAS
ncbi:NADPH-dependent FMN reductase [Microtetraspora malaysiensis]|uniref:NADPH-dependent FMN reductase n=1 Tax=Microtetraspora malaysiensis TaxID=161358 RepID=UPI003D8A6287